MAEYNPISFLLNQSDSTTQEVASPAFSLTKVMTTSALVLTPLATYLVKQIGKVDFSSGQIIALIVSVLALLALTSSADVIARAVATSGSAKKPLTTFAPPITATHIRVDKDTNVKVIAARTSGDTSQFLVVEGDSVTWLSQDQVSFKD